MHKKYNKFLIVSFIGVLILGGYFYFNNNLKSEAATASEDGDLVSSSTTTDKPATTVANTNNSINDDTAFLVKLASLKRIKIDISLFGDKAFKMLVDNNIKLDPVPYGRINPFSPTDKQVVVNNKPVVSLKTNPATSISNKSAVLNGSLEGATSDNIYFQYGVKEPLNKVTPKVTASLVNSFASTITLLNSKTTYFYRAVANINGTLVYGDIISFNTN